MSIVKVANEEKETFIKMFPIPTFSAEEIFYDSYHLPALTTTTSTAPTMVSIKPQFEEQKGLGVETSQWPGVNFINVLRAAFTLT